MRSSVVTATLSGVLLAVAYQFVGVLGFVAYVPLLAMLASKPSMRWWREFGLFYLTFFIYHAATNWWICSWQERTDPYLFVSGIALAVGHPIFLSFPFYVLASVRRRIGAQWMLLLAPFCITGFEWMHGQTDASYPWLSIGYMLTRTPWGQLAEFVGVYGLTFLLAATNALLAWWFVFGRKRTKRMTVPLGTAVVLILLGIVGYARQLVFQEKDSSAGFLVTIVQPSLDPWDKWTGGRENVLILERIVDSLRASTHGVNPGLVVWPETAIPYTIRRDLYTVDWQALRGWVDTSCVALLTGYADYVVYPRGTAPPSARRVRIDDDLRYDVFNAAMVLSARGTTQVDSIPVHQKSMLTPFAERLPFADQLTFAMKWIEWGVGISAWGKGQTRKPLAYGDSVRIGTIICIESIYPEVARDLVNNGANVLCVITNDAWYNGTWGPEQHFDIARLRAIEERRTIIRCGMSGVSGFILPDGTNDPHVSNQCPPMHRGVLQAHARTKSYQTMYARIGDPWSPIWFGLSVLILVITRFPRVIRKMHIRFPQCSQEIPT